MRVIRLSEPSDIVLEQILLGTDRKEQFAIIGRVASHLGCRIEGNAAERYLNEKPRRVGRELPSP